MFFSWFAKNKNFKNKGISGQILPFLIIIIAIFLGAAAIVGNIGKTAIDYSCTATAADGCSLAAASIWSLALNMLQQFNQDVLLAQYEGFYGALQGMVAERDSYLSQAYTALMEAADIIESIPPVQFAVCQIWDSANTAAMGWLDAERKLEDTAARNLFLALIYAYIIDGAVSSFKAYQNDAYQYAQAMMDDALNNPDSGAIAAGKAFADNNGCGLAITTDAYVPNIASYNLALTVQDSPDPFGESGNVDVPCANFLTTPQSPVVTMVTWPDCVGAHTGTPPPISDYTGPWAPPEPPGPIIPGLPWTVPPAPTPPTPPPSGPLPPRTIEIALGGGVPGDEASYAIMATYNVLKAVENAAQYCMDSSYEESTKTALVKGIWEKTIYWCTESFAVDPEDQWRGIRLKPECVFPPPPGSPPQYWPNCAPSGKKQQLFADLYNLRAQQVEMPNLVVVVSSVVEMARVVSALQDHNAAIPDAFVPSRIVSDDPGNGMIIDIDSLTFEDPGCVKCTITKSGQNNTTSTAAFSGGSMTQGGTYTPRLVNPGECPSPNG